MDTTPKAVTLKPAYSTPCYSVDSSPTEFKEENHRHKLSASLKERLKRSRRSFISPLPVAKRLCVDDAETDGQQVSADSKGGNTDPSDAAQTIDENRNVSSGSERLPGPVAKPTLVPSEELVQRLKKEVKEKTETLRRLKMVKMYRCKNDLAQLQTLIDKWRSCAQAALYELQIDAPIDGRKADLSELMDLFGLEDGILQFDRTEDDFTT
ncbi:swi5-dependent recombination DNA repair protein 1 homolog [Cololabis saira]|uniref:swi5-dependent recombination DNA repair protein 1 homolog n=1 Tax=Cololabis saira TaxID=129043 RepID=UPI002AD2F25C|nr:swi5-dependent recombination DNA repair protein 1 homolog [Cololabis saira]